VIPGSPATATVRRLLAELGESGRGTPSHIAGRIAYAETLACPGIGDRLVASGRIRPEAWHAAPAEGRVVIERNELAPRVVAAIGDATVVFVPLGHHTAQRRRTVPDGDAQRVRLVAVRSPQDGPR
jgi:hypothetical protein